jgi:RNA 2',3'-cyclic 3'-phosphodiesterase
MRLFVAVTIDADVIERMSRSIEELRERVAVRAPRARVRWVPGDQLHVTVRFIGEANETQADSIATVLGPSLPLDRFQLVFRGLGVFPERGAPRVFWAGIAAGAEQLAAVEAEVTERLEACGIAPDSRAYRPHVTLARVKDAGGLRVRGLFDGLADRAFGLSPVDAITLFESRQSSDGSVYVPLQSTRLQ